MESHRAGIVCSGCFHLLLVYEKYVEFGSEASLSLHRCVGRPKESLWVKGFQSLSLFSLGFSISNTCLHEHSYLYLIIWLPWVCLWKRANSGKQVEKGSITQGLVLEHQRTHKCLTCESEQDFYKVTEADRKDAYWKKHPFPTGSKCYCGID